MNLVMLFNSVLPKLNACHDVTIRHSACRSIPDDNPHCYPGALECMQSVLACKQPTQSQAQDLIWFLIKVAMFDTLDAQDIADNFTAAYGYKLTV